MKILFCIDVYRPSRGGAEAYLHDLAAGLKARGHHVSVAAATADRDGDLEIIPIRAPSHPRLLRERALARAPVRFRKSGAFDAVVAFRHAFGADVFQPHGGLHADSLEGAVRPLSASRTLRRLLYLFKLLSPKNAFFLHADRRLFSRGGPVKVAALSEMTARSIRRRWGDAADITVIPNGVDIGRFHPGLRAKHREAVLEEEGIPAGSSVAIFCGHNFALKGLREALEGLAAFRARERGLHLLVVGRGRRAGYERLASRLGLADPVRTAGAGQSSIRTDRGIPAFVRFLGERADMERLLGAGDVLLHPTWYDPCSLVVLEALGAGVPVITTRYNGACELMTDGEEGFILPDPADARSLAAALESVLGPEHGRFQEKAARMGQARDFQKHVDSMLELLARSI